jgi:hypothetical protein
MQAPLTEIIESFKLGHAAGLSVMQRDDGQFAIKGCLGELQLYLVTSAVGLASVADQIQQVLLNAEHCEHGTPAESPCDKCWAAYIYEFGNTEEE